MSTVLKHPNKIVVNTPSLEFNSTTLKLTTGPALNNSNTDFLTRNTGTGNIERLTTVPNIYTTNGTLTSDRTVSGGFNSNLTFTGGLAAFTVTGWSSGINVNAQGSVSISAPFGTVTMDGALVNIGATAPTTVLSANTKALQLLGSNLTMNNIPISTLSDVQPQFLQIRNPSRVVTADLFPYASGAYKATSNGTSVLTSSTPTSSLGVIPQSLLAAINFSQAIPYGIIYDGSGPSKSVLKYFTLNCSGYIDAPVNQVYTAAFMVNNVPVIGSLQRITVTGTGPTQFTLMPRVLQLNVTDVINVGFGRETSDTALTSFAYELTATPAAYYTL